MQQILCINFVSFNFIKFIDELLSQSVQSLSCVWLFATPWTAAHQASLSITNSRRLPKRHCCDLCQKSVLVTSLRFSMYSIISSANTNIFLLSLLGFHLFFFSDCHASDFQNYVSKSGGSGHPYLVPDLRGNAFSFPLLSMILAVDLSYMAFIMLKYGSSMSSFWRVLQSFFKKNSYISEIHSDIFKDEIIWCLEFTPRDWR